MRITAAYLRNTSVASAIVTMAVLTSILPSVGHSWVEEARCINSYGLMVGSPGYPRGAIPRTDPAFNDHDALFTLPPLERGPIIYDTDLISRHKVTDYIPERPMLRAAPGQFVALRYQENGHVSLPENQPDKPLNRGTIFIYGTTQPLDNDTFLGIHKVWTPDGTGGDGRGCLLATRNYDDGQCHQTNNGSIASERADRFPKGFDHDQGNDLWCQSDFQLPEDLVIGSLYTVYWVWDWPTLDTSKINLEDTRNGRFPTQGEGVKVPEVYISTLDIQIVAPEALQNDAGGNGNTPGSIGPINVSSAQQAVQANIGRSAILGQLTNLFQVEVNFANDSQTNKHVVPSSPSMPLASLSATSFSTLVRPTGTAPVTNNMTMGIVVTVTLPPVTVTTVVTVARPLPSDSETTASEAMSEVTSIPVQCKATGPMFYKSSKAFKRPIKQFSA